VRSDPTFWLIARASGLTAYVLLTLSGSSQTAPAFWLNPQNGVVYNIAVQAPQYRVDSLDALLNIPVGTTGAGAAASGWLFEGFRMLGLGFSGIAFIGVPIALLWAGTGWMLGRSQDDIRRRNEAIRRPDESIFQSAAFQSAAAPAVPDAGGGQRVGDVDPVQR